MIAASLEAERARSWAMISCSRDSLTISCLFQASSLIILSCSLFSMVSRNRCCITSCFSITCFIRLSKKSIIRRLLLLPPPDEPLFRFRRYRLLSALEGSPCNKSSSSCSSSSSEPPEEEDEVLDEKLIPRAACVVGAEAGAAADPVGAVIIPELRSGGNILEAPIDEGFKEGLLILTEETGIGLLVVVPIPIEIGATSKLVAGETVFALEGVVALVGVVAVTAVKGVAGAADTLLVVVAVLCRASS